MMNENLQIKNTNLLQKYIKKMLFDLVKNQVITSYHRERTSGDMNPEDFIEELARKIELSIGEFVQTVDNRSNWENQPEMIKENNISRAELKKLIKSRISKILS